MAYFSRSASIPRVTGDYTAFRSFVREDFRQCCAYCLLHEFWMGGEANFELDHFRPVSKFPHLVSSFYNLYYACHVCNHTKHNHWPSEEFAQRGIQLVDLCQDEFDQHYHLHADGNLEPLTESAHYTLLLLRLNSPHLVRLRAFAMRHELPLDSVPE